MLSVLIVANEWHKYKELEECLINDYYVDFAESISPEVVELSKIEFSYEILFYLKRPDFREIPALSRLFKNKIVICRVFDGENLPFNIKEVLYVADRIILKASAMRGKLEYFKGVDKILALNAFHMEIDNNYEIVLNGDKSTKVLMGDIIVRTGKSVVFGVRYDNIAAFSADIFINEAFKDGDNCKFIRNLLNSMLGTAEVY